jgi:hypothetical protein
MEKYTQYMNDDADDDERQAAAQVMEGLAELRREAKVHKLALERAALRRRAFWLRLFGMVVALTLMVGATYLFLSQKKLPVTDVPTPQPQERNTLPIPPAAPTIPAGPPKTIKKQAPIAELNRDEPLPNPRYSAPEPAMIRGDETTNKALKVLLDQVWYTEYPLLGLQTATNYGNVSQMLQQRDFNAAYIALDGFEREQIAAFRRRMDRINQERMEKDSTYKPVAAMWPPNDTLLYLKAYSLLEMGEGQEALLYFNQIRDPYPTWTPQLNWYRGLALLLTDQRAEAIALFRQLANQPNHPYRRQAAKALEILN